MKIVRNLNREKRGRERGRGQPGKGTHEIVRSVLIKDKDDEVRNLKIAKECTVIGRYMVAENFPWSS